jgi:hypothetical protein
VNSPYAQGSAGPPPPAQDRDVPGFRLDEAAARAFLHRALRRHAGTLDDGEGDGAGKHEDWRLTPGWDLENIHADDTGRIEELVYNASRVSRVILTDLQDVHIELQVITPFDGEWTYQWTVTLPAGAGFALCDPYCQEFRHLGWPGAGDAKGQGIRTALSILREAEAAGNEILRGYRAAAGAIPCHRPACTAADPATA